MRRLFGTAAGVAVLALGASAQDVNPNKMKAEFQALLEKSRVVGAAGGIMGQVVKGAPYSAQETNESTQMLADGTRIRNETKAMVYRDSEGRVRREVGDMVTIWDPVTNVNYTLDTKNMRAFKSSMAAPVFMRHSAMAGSGMGTVAIAGTAAGSATAVPALPMPAMMGQVTVKDGMVTVTEDGQTRTFPMPANGEWTSEDGKMHAMMRKGEGPDGGAIRNFVVRQDEMAIIKDDKMSSMALPAPDAINAVFVNSIPSEMGAGKIMMRRFDGGKEEALGEQTIEGVKSTGTRHTATIEAGAIGNDRAISTVIERWYSAELQTDVMTRRSDPRMGESVYKLTNINRSEPAPYLFQVPSGYNLNDRR
jgi:hypothetical protein